MFPGIVKVNYLVKSHKTIENPNLLMNNLIKNMYIISMKEEGRKTPSLEFNLLDLISFYDEDDKLKVDYSLLNKKLDNLESIISTFITSCFISSFITSMFVNIIVKYINDSLIIYDDEKETKEKIMLINSLLSNNNCNCNTNSNLIFKCVESQEQTNHVDVNSNQDNHQEDNNDDNNCNDNDNNNGDGSNDEMCNNNGSGNNDDNNNNNNNNDRDNNEDNDDTKNNLKNKKSNKKKENKNKKDLSEEDKEENNEVKTENSATVEKDYAFEPTVNDGIGQFMNQNKEFSKSIIPTLYHRSSTGSLKKPKLLGAIGTKDDSLQYINKDNDAIGSNHVDNKNIHLIHELSSNNINKMPSIIEDRTEEGSDIEDMKLILKKDQCKKKGDKLSKLLINKASECSLDETKKDEGSYTSLAYSPFSNNFELWKNNIVESLPYRSTGLGSHRNSICCPYDIITNFCTSNNVRRGSLPSLNYSYHNNSNMTTSNDINTPPQLSSASASNLSYSSTSSSTSSSLSSPSSNSTMVNQSSNNDGHPNSFNKLNFNNSKGQKSGSSAQLSSSSTPSTKMTELAKDDKNDIDNSAYTTPVGSSKLTHSASFSGTFNNYSLSNSSSCNSLSAIANTLNNSSSSSTLNFIDNNNNGKTGSTPGGLKQSMSSGDFSNLSSMVTSSIETATKIPEEDKNKSDIDSNSIQTMDAIDKLNGKGNGSSSSSGNNDDGKKSIGGSSCGNNDNGNVSLATSIFDEDRTSFTSFYDKDSISTENGLGFYNYPNIFSRGRSFSISVDSLFADPNSNDHEFEGDSLDTFDTYGNNDLGHMKSVNSFQFRYNNSSRRQSCPLISSYSDYSLSKKKSMDEISNLGSMVLDSLDEMSETKSIDRTRKGSAATLNDFTSSSSTLFKEDSFLSSLNYSLTNDTSFQSKKGGDSDFNSLLSSKSSLNLSSSGLNEGLNDSNPMTSSFSNTVSFLSTANGNNNGNEKASFPYRKTRSYSMSSVSYPFAYSTLFNSENENQEGLASLSSTTNKNKSSMNAKIEKPFVTTKGAISDIKNPWLSSDNKSKSSSNLFKLNTFTENPDYDFGFNLGWKTDKKLPSNKLNTDLYNINEGQTSSINGITSKSLSTLKNNTTSVTTGNNSSSSLNTIPNSNSNDMLFNGNKISTTTNPDDKSSDSHGKTKKKLLGWGFLAKYNFIDFDDDAYQEDKKTNTTNGNMMKNRQSNNMPYASNSSYSIYGNGSINPSMINANPYMPQTSYNGPNYNGNMMNKMNYMNSGSTKGNNGTVIYNGKNNTNTNANTLSYQQKNGMVYYNNDGNGVPLTNNFNVTNNSASGTGPNNTNSSGKNHPVYHPNSKKGNAKIINNYNNYYQNPGMVSRNMYNENANMNNSTNRYKYNSYKNGSTNNPTMNPLNKMINTNGIKNDNALNSNNVNEGKNEVKVNNAYPSNPTSNNKNNVSGTKKKVKNSNPNNNANVNNPNNSASVVHDLNAKINAANTNANTTKTTTTTKSKKKNRNNASKNKNNSNNNATVNDTNIEANIATILSSINGENNNANDKINTSVTKSKKNNPNKANSNKNSTNTGNASPSSKDDNEMTTRVSLSEPFNLNIAEFIPGSSNNTKKVNEKNKEVESHTEESSSVSANLNNEIFNASFHPAKNTSAPFIESSLYNNKEN